MDRLTRWGLAIAILAVVGATAAVVAPTAAGQTLVVSDAETGENLLEIPVEDGDEVTLAYTHSVEKTPIEDVYVIEETTLQMDRMVFRSHGAGLPSDEAIEQTDEGYVVSSDERYEDLGVVPGEIAGHELVVGDDRYDLVERSDGPVVLSVTDTAASNSKTGLEHLKWTHDTR
ncbi:DUF1850 domain-containing protein [Natronolimnobius baerhuensis]|uniref:DUF1850 domain-containing protein n=1 Tax=Natronolimnobius baerhuensis TaxID=253108 RepID=A0A202E640_9EURY|nr:DUF1850 domain-containing protein [Natronolimnobius baerhuensis]OVE83664.1 hypothetical protein B2G88_14640 [Natronolimnobius baerhuensis]